MEKKKISQVIHEQAFNNKMNLTSTYINFCLAINSNSAHNWNKIKWTTLNL